MKPRRAEKRKCCSRVVCFFDDVKMADITMSGWLDKRGGQDASKGWKKRWCILSDKMFRYYKSDSDSTPAGTIFGEDIEDAYEDYHESQKDPAKYGFIFKLITKGRDYVFNAPTAAKREEWVKKVKSLLEQYRSELPQVPEIHYATVDVFVNKGIRVNGDIGTVLVTQLSSPSSKKVTDDRGMFIDNPLPHTTVLNLFTQHGWLLATAFQSNSIPFGSNSPAPSDTLVFTHPIHKES